MLAALATSACYHPQRGGEAAVPKGRSQTGTQLPDIARIYQQMGLMASPLPVPYVANVAYFAAGKPDSTLVLVSVSMPTKAFNFVRDGDRYRAPYDVTLDVRDGTNLMQHVEAHEEVRVASFKETSRGDESVIFQRFLTLPPGQFVLNLELKDGESGRQGTDQTMLRVPRMGDGSLSSAVPVHQVTPRTNTDSLPGLVTSTRAAATFGQDSLLPVYVEAYGNGSPVVQATVRGDGNATLWQDTVTLERRGVLLSGMVNVPVAKVGIGVTTLTLARRGSSDDSKASLFVSLGEDLPVASFEEMLSYLRFYATPDRVRSLRDTAADARPAAWAAFLKRTDPVFSTSLHEGLRDYFAKIRVANERFRDEAGAGWLTDRGMAFVALGEPDQLYEQSNAEMMSQRGRTQVWEYRDAHLQLVFVDQTGFGRWRLTSTSLQDLQSIIRRRLVN
jgi:GWxTD domain-containing protein